MNKKNSAFTLIEIIIALSIFVIIAGLVVSFLVYYLRSYSFSFDENQAVSHAQYGITTILREIMEARISEDGAWPLFTLNDNEFGFYSDVTDDGLSDKVRYFLDGNQLKRGVIEPVGIPISYPPETEQFRIIADFVEASSSGIFQYYNGDWPGDTINNPLPAEQRLLNTRFVNIYLKININPQNIQPYELTSGVQLRNLKTNL
jgi:prepilin-type N-terminal cleavage/methylation domain-containing protein